MNISEYTQYILWGGVALIALVVIHGLWMNWRARVSRRARMQSTERQPAEQTRFDFDPQAGAIEGEVQAWDDGSAGETAAENGAAAETRPGRRIPVAGRRTEPTVPRKDRPFASGADAHAAPAWVEAPVGAEDEVGDVIVIWVFAKRGLTFDGEGLLRVFKANDLQYAGNVFRKLDANTRCPLFTVANGVEPGTFDLSDVDSLATPRVVFLLQLSTLKDPMPAFNDMLEVAQDVAVSLQGDLKDERKNDLSGQTIEHCRQRIRDFKRVNMRA